MSYRAYRKLKKSLKMVSNEDEIVSFTEFNELLSSSPHLAEEIRLKAKLRILQLRLREAKIPLEKYRVKREMAKVKMLILREKLRDKARGDYIAQEGGWGFRDVVADFTDGCKYGCKAVVKGCKAVVKAVLPPSFLYLGRRSFTSKGITAWVRERAKKSLRRKKTSIY